MYMTFLRDFENIISIPVVCDCPRVEHSSVENLRPAAEIPLRILIKNPSKVQSFKNVKITSATNIAQIAPQELLFTVFLPNDEIVLVSEPVIVPETGFFYYRV